MDTKLSILFYGKTSKTTNEDLLPIYLRVTIDGKRFEISTQRYIHPVKWSSDAGKVKGNTEEAISINFYLDNLRSKVHSLQSQLIQQGELVTAESFKEKWLGKENRSRMLLKIF